MTGYQETLTDPSYRGQIVVMTAPHIGNTGVNDEDFESRQVWVDGYVVRDPARVPSSWRSQRSLDDLLAEQGVVGISGIDTRALTRHLRERGAMRAAVSSDVRRRRRPAGTRQRRAGDGRVQLPRRRHDRRDVRRPRDRRQAVHRGGDRPRHQGHDAAPDGRARHRGARAAGDVVARRRARRAARRRVHVQRPRRPGDGRPRRRGAARRARDARSRTSGSAWATRSSAARSAAAPTSSSTATAASTSRCRTAPPARSRSPRTTTASPSTRRWTTRSTRPSARPASPTSASTTTSSRGWPCSSSRRSASSTTPRPRPARTTPPTCSTGSSTS